MKQVPTKAYLAWLVAGVAILYLTLTKETRYDLILYVVILVGGIYAGRWSVE